MLYTKVNILDPQLPHLDMFILPLGMGESIPAIFSVSVGLQSCEL